MTNTQACHGASGRWLKSATRDQISGGIRSGAAGGGAWDADIARLSIKPLQTRLREDVGEPCLSERQLEIRWLLADGLVKQEIASRSNLSQAPLATALGRICAQLKLTNARAVADRSPRRTILPLERQDAG